MSGRSGEPRSLLSRTLCAAQAAIRLTTDEPEVHRVVAILSTQPAGLPLPRTASGLSLDIVNLTCSRGIARLLRSRGAQRRQRQVEAAYALSAMAAPSSPLSLWDAVDPSRGRAVRVHHVDSATAPGEDDHRPVRRPRGRSLAGAVALPASPLPR